MPRFYFDTDDGDRRVRDDVGIELADFQDVADEAMGLLRDLAHHDMPVGCWTVTVTVRDASGALAYRTTMIVAGERYGDPPPRG